MRYAHPPLPHHTPLANSLTAISKSFAACTRVLLGESADLPGVPPLALDLPILPGAAKSLQATAAAHKPYWTSMAGFDVAGACF